MTDREKLIELLEEVPISYELCMRMMGHCPTVEKPCYECLADYLFDNGVTFAKDTDVPSKWISVEDRLPEVDVMVLVIVSGKPMSNVTLENSYELAEYDPEGWILEMWPEWMDAEVSHWMPLPEPPEVER